MVDNQMELLEKYVDKKITIGELAFFIENLVYDNPYFTFKESPIVKFVDFGIDNQYGGFNEYSNNIYISIKLLEDIVAGKKNLIEVITTVGHEFEHKLQHALKNNYEKIKNNKRFKNLINSKSNEVIDALNKKELTEQEFSILFHVFKNFFGEEYVRKFDNLSKEELYHRLKKMWFASYLQSAHEKDAREGGFNYAIKTLKWFKTNNKSNEKIAKWCDEQKIILENKYKKDNFLIKFDFFDYKEFENQIKNISINQLIEICSDFTNLRFLIEKDNSSATRFILNKVLDKAVEIMFADRPIQEIIDTYFLCVNNGNIIMGDKLSSMILENPKISKNIISKFKETTFEMLKLGDFNNKTCMMDFSNILTLSQYTKLIHHYIETDRTSFAFIFINTFGFFKTNIIKKVNREEYEKERKKIADDICKYCLKMFSKIDKNDSEFILENFYDMQSSSIFDILPLEKKESLMETFALYKEKAEKLDKSFLKEQKENIYLKTYGEKQFKYKKQQEEEIEFEIEDYRKKSK